MKDFLGRELAIGDIVAVTPKNYRGLIKAKVIKFTPQQVRVSYDSGYSHEEYLVYPDCVIKVF